MNRGRVTGEPPFVCDEWSHLQANAHNSPKARSTPDQAGISRPPRVRDRRSPRRCSPGSPRASSAPPCASTAPPASSPSRSRTAPRAGFEAAVEAARAAGFEPVVRLAGGRAAVFHEGTLALAWATPGRAARGRHPRALRAARRASSSAALRGARRRRPGRRGPRRVLPRRLERQRPRAHEARRDRPAADRRRRARRRGAGGDRLRARARGARAGLRGARARLGPARPPAASPTRSRGRRSADAEEAIVAELADARSSSSTPSSTRRRSRSPPSSSPATSRWDDLARWRRRPPRCRPSRRGGAPRQKVTPLELFFDLVFVFAFTQVTGADGREPDLGGPRPGDAGAGGRLVGVGRLRVADQRPALRRRDRAGRAARGDGRDAGRGARGAARRSATTRSSSASPTSPSA